MDTLILSAAAPGQICLGIEVWLWKRIWKEGLQLIFGPTPGKKKFRNFSSFSRKKEKLFFRWIGKNSGRPKIENGIGFSEFLVNPQVSQLVPQKPEPRSCCCCCCSWRHLSCCCRCLCCWRLKFSSSCSCGCHFRCSSLARASYMLQSCCCCCCCHRCTLGCPSYRKLSK